MVMTIIYQIEVTPVNPDNPWEDWYDDGGEG